MPSQFIKINDGLGFDKWSKSIRITDGKGVIYDGGKVRMVTMQELPALLEEAFNMGVKHQKDKIRAVLL